MRGVCLAFCLTLTLLAAGSSLAGESEPVPPEAQPAPQTSPQRTLLPEELQQVLTPEPENKIPVEYIVGHSPCSVSIPCRFGSSVSCSTSTIGQSCYYRWDYSPTYPGWVRCGNTKVSCNPAA